MSYSLGDGAVHTEAAAVLARLIESVTIYPDGPRGAEAGIRVDAEIVARVEDLMVFCRKRKRRP